MYVRRMHVVNEKNEIKFFAFVDSFLAECKWLARWHA